MTYFLRVCVPQLMQFGLVVRAQVAPSQFDISALDLAGEPDGVLAFSVRCPTAGCINSKSTATDTAANNRNADCTISPPHGQGRQGQPRQRAGDSLM